MNPPDMLRTLLAAPTPLLALAPMQDVTDRAFLDLIARYGGADLYVTEYFRVYPGSLPNREILRSVTENRTGRPVVAQLIGNDVPELVRTARELQRHPVAGIDLNLGCPAPVVYRKCAGGGLLRDLPRVDAILGALRAAVAVPFTVKTRLGFDSADRFDDLLQILARHRLDIVTVHGRTVTEMYRSPVRYDLIARAARSLSCPVLANGNVHSAAHALDVLARTGARGLMIGRGAIRNPWIFDQIRRRNRGEPVAWPTGRAALEYLGDLYRATRPAGLGEVHHVTKMKKYLNYIALGVEPTGDFLHRVRRAGTESEFFALCGEFLSHDRPMPLEPFAFNLGPGDLLAGEHR
jgi:tRNA-dihydrouridine synthase